METGKVALKQALRKLGYSYSQIAKICETSTKNTWLHCNRKNNGCKMWTERSQQEQKQAIKDAKKLAGKLKPTGNFNLVLEKNRI
jgi:hypothetical protein